MTQPAKQTSSAKDVFSYLLMIIMLYMGIVSFVSLLWQYIGFSFPDVLDYSFVGASGAIRSGMSVLLIVWPVFVLMAWMIGKDLQAHVAKKDSRIRKWLLYLTVFLSALTIVIDLIALVNTFLDGELSVRFLLKVLVVLIVAGSVFAYYFWELRREPSGEVKIPFYAAIVTSVVVCATIIGGFCLVGSPSVQRELRIDEQRVMDLQSIQSQILNIWSAKASLPTSLQELNDPLYGYQVPVDPLTKTAYAYTKTGDYTFTLCAKFVRSSKLGNEMRPTSPLLYPQTNQMDYWNHEAGDVCFDRTIDPELFKPSQKIIETSISEEMP